MTLIEIKNFDIMSVAKIMAIVGAVFGLIMAILGLILTSFIGVEMLAATGIPATAGFDLMALVYGLIYGLIGGFIAGAVYSFIYNTVAGFVGGIKFNS